jgi:competence protein ComEA
VYVTGAVANPGELLTLPPESRVQAALDAAGGAASSADLSRINLAAILHDGDQVHVPEQGEAGSAIATPTDLRVHINTATLEELMLLPGIGETTAQAILDYRAANGLFNNLEALDAVEGIGPSTLEALADLVRFD